MPRQFFTLKTLLTTPSAAAAENAPVAEPQHAAAVLEQVPSQAQSSREVAVEEMQPVPVQARYAEVPQEPEYQEYAETAYDDEIVGAPPAYDEEIIFPEEFDDGLIDFAVPAPPPPEPVHAELAVPEEPDLPPPVARFADMICYDGSFEPLQNQVGQILSEAMNEVMRLRARAAEAFERKAEEMLGDLACTVLGRELQIAPADLNALVAMMGARMIGELPLKIRVAPEEARHIQGPVEPDRSLAYGDLVFDVEDGELDLRLGTRIASLLRAQQVQV